MKLLNQIIGITLFSLVFSENASPQIFAGDDLQGIMAGVAISSFATDYTDITSAKGFNFGYNYGAIFSDEFSLMSEGLISRNVFKVKAFMNDGINVIWDDQDLKTWHFSGALYGCYSPPPASFLGLYGGGWAGLGFCGFVDDYPAWNIGKPDNTYLHVPYSEFCDNFNFTIDYGPILGVCAGTEEFLVHLRYRLGLANYLRNLDNFYGNQMKFWSLQLELNICFSGYGTGYYRI